MSVSKPMGKKMRTTIKHALEKMGVVGECVGITETEKGTVFKMEVNILIPDK